MIITIDGPAGSGKSTAARKLAQRLGFAHLDTGAMYRAVTLRALRSGIDLSDPAALERCAREADIRMTHEPSGQRVLLDGQDVTREIRDPQVTENAHYVANAGNVRGVLVELQRAVAAQLGDVVTEGRDQGSVAFPDAEAKFFLVARAEERARRRLEELRSAGVEADYQEILAAIVQRDRRDQGRRVGPLVRPPGAIEIDTTDLNIEQTVHALAAYVEALL